MVRIIQNNENPDREELVIIRNFDAPKDLVFQAFAEKERLKEWWGPEGFSMAVIRFDFKPGGIFHYRFDSPKMDTTWGRFVFSDIQAPDLIQFVVSFSDRNAGISRATFNEDWPLELVHIIRFSRNNGQTEIELRIFPIDATKVEEEVFYESQTHLREGFNGTFDRLEKYLEKITK